MASMGFDLSSINEIMSLIDDNKDHVSEGEYLKLCNAMKFLHQSLSEQSRKEEPQWSELDWLLMRMRSLQDRINIYERIPNPIVNLHKQKVIEELTGFAITGPRGGIRKMKTIDIQNQIQQLISDGRVRDMSQFMTLAATKRDEEIQSAPTLATYLT